MAVKGAGQGCRRSPPLTPLLRHPPPTTPHGTHATRGDGDTTILEDTHATRGDGDTATLEGTQATRENNPPLGMH